MAIGWSKDGMVQEQIDNSIEDAITKVRQRLQPPGKSLEFCEECDAPIPKNRQLAIPGVRLCVECQQEQDNRNKR